MVTFSSKKEIQNLFVLTDGGIPQCKLAADVGLEAKIFFQHILLRGLQQSQRMRPNEIVTCWTGAFVQNTNILLSILHIADLSIRKKAHDLLRKSTFNGENDQCL